MVSPVIIDHMSLLSSTGRLLSFPLLKPKSAPPLEPARLAKV